MKPNQKVFDHLKCYDYYLPYHLEFVQKLFYEQMVDNLGLSESFRTSFLSQISKIGQFAHNEQLFRQLVKDSWQGFFNKIPLNSICVMLDGQEQKDIREYMLNVMIEPKKYELIYIDELLQIYDLYLQEKRCVTNIVNRTKFRMILTKLNCSKFILSQDEKYQPQIKQYLFDFYIKKIEKIDEKERIRVEQINKINLFHTLFEILFDQCEGQGNIFNHLKQIVLILLDEQQNFLNAFQIFKSFYQMYIDKEKLLFERIDPRAHVDHNRIAMELHLKYKEKKDLKEALRSIAHKSTQTIDYKQLLKELVTRDLYSKDNEQIFFPLLKEFDLNNSQKNRRQQPIDNTLIQEIKLLGFNKLDKRNEIEFDNLNFSINLLDNSNIVITNKKNKQRAKCSTIKELHHFMSNYNL